MTDLKNDSNPYWLSQRRAREFVKNRASTIYFILFISIVLAIFSVFAMKPAAKYFSFWFSLVTIQMFAFYLLISDLKKLMKTVKEEDDREFYNQLKCIRQEKQTKGVKK